MQLADTLDESGYPSTLVALAPGLSGGLDIPACGPSRLAPRTLTALRQRCRQARVVIAHGSTTLPAVAAATLGAGTPFVYRSIGDPRVWINTWARRARVRAAAGRAVRVVALWRGSAVAWHEVLHVPAARITVIPNAVPALEFDPPSPQQRLAARAALGSYPGDRVVLYLGSLSPEKRVDLAIHAMAQVPAARLVVAGDGPERPRLQAMAAAVGAPVQFVGPVERPQTVLAAADVMVVPSDTEGQPAVVIEAGLSCVPVVATRVGGLAELVEDGRTGLLVGTRDKAGLAAAINLALARREEMGQAGRARCVACFDLAHVAKRWELLIDSVASSLPDQRRARPLP
jgi:glycosyltransferase involved in cell wall biosynthesis